MCIFFLILQALAAKTDESPMPEKDQSTHQKVTIYDIARESGFSYSTVSRVLNGFEFVKDSTREKIRAAANRLGYVPNVQARALAGGRSNVIGLLVPSLDNGYIGEIARGIDEELAKIGYDLMLYTTHRHQGKETAYINNIVRGLAAGLLTIVPLVPPLYSVALQEQQFPYVLIDQFDDSGLSSIVDSTNWQGMYEATSYLLDLGHTRIGFIKGLMQIRSAIDRLDGYKSALADRGIPIRSDLIAEGDFYAARGYQATSELLALEPRPTAIIASNDLTAFSVMSELRARGLDIPRDMSVIGFDDIPQARIVHPKLTTVHQPLDQMGRIAVKLLLEQIENPANPPRHITLATKLIIRDSCQTPT